MAETLNLSAPDQAKPGTTKYQVRELEKRRGIRWDVATSALVSVPEESFIRIQLIGDGGVLREEWIRGADADGLLIAFNKVNLATKSEQKRVLEWLAANRPALLGTTVTGTADA